MTFSYLGVLGVLVGLVGLAGLFALLQRLRVRHRPVVVETALFWRQALEETRARVFVERFRHPWTYLLLLTIASLLWLVFAGPRWSMSGEQEYVVLLDGSAAMARDGRFERAKALAIAHAAGLPREHRSVVLCGGEVGTVLRPGEELVLLERRLAFVRPTASPSTVARALRTYAHLGPATPTDVCIVGDAELDVDLLAQLPAGVTVRRLPVERGVPRNRGITALGVSPARSGCVDAVDVLVDVVAVGADGEAEPEISIDGAVLAQAAAIERLPDRVCYRFLDVPAHGGVLAATLAGADELSLDDVARFALPDRRPLGVAIAADLPEVVRQVIEADPGLRVDDASPAIVIRRRGSGFGPATLPALELIDRDAAEDSFVALVPEGLDPQAVLHDLYERLGLWEIDPVSLATASGRDITMGTLPGPVRRLWIWEELLREEYDFVRSRALPLFFGVGVRWLLDLHEGPVRAAVGEAVGMAGSRVIDPAGREVRPLAASFVPTSAGRHFSDRGERFEASLLDVASTLGGSETAGVPEAGTPTGKWSDPVTWLLLLALALTVTEWWLYRRGKIA